MANLQPSPQGLRVALARKEEIGALKKSFTIPWSQVTNIARVDDLWGHLRGIRAPGTGLPGVIMLGTTRYQGLKDFNAVYGHKSGFVVTLNGNEFARVLVTNTDNSPIPEQLAS